MDIKDIIAQHTDKETGKTDAEAVMNAINAELPKEFVSKEQYNKQAEQLKTANSTLDTLKKNNTDNAELQKEVDDWRAKYETATKDYAVREALREAGAKDLDYMIYKLGGDVELDKEGNIKDLDSKIKSLKENNADWFAQAGAENPQKKEAGDTGGEPTPPAPTTPAGYKPIDNGLPKGNAANPLDTVKTQFEQALGL